MSRWFDGVRGRVVLMVVAVTACLYSLLGTIGFVQIAHSGRAEIRERIGHVLDTLEAGLRTGGGTVTITTPDGVSAYALDPRTPQLPGRPGEITVRRSVLAGGTRVALIGSASQARLTDSLQTLYRGLWIGIPVAVLLTGMMTGMAMRRALRPVSEITGLAATIGLHNSSARVPVPDTGDEIHQLATTLNEMLDRIDAGRVAQKQFTSDAAHELRTPLMALQGEIEIAQRTATGPDDAFLQRVSTLSHRLGDRVDDLVLLSTLDEQPPLRLQRDVLLDCVRTEAHDVAGETEIVGDDVAVDVDPKLMGRAIRNLLANAHRHARRSVRATVSGEGDWVWLHVDDDGDGIPHGDAEVIFGRFRRLEEARSSDSGGAGLGLAIVASVAAAHGGTVSATTGPLGGARFSLRLPAAGSLGGEGDPERDVVPSAQGGAGDPRAGWST